LTAVLKEEDGENIAQDRELLPSSLLYSILIVTQLDSYQAFHYATQQKHPETIQIKRTRLRERSNTNRYGVASLLVAVESLNDT